MMWKEELVAKSESPTTAIRDRPATTAGAPLVPRLATPLRLSCGPKEIAVALSGVPGRRRASTIKVFGPGTSWSLSNSTRLRLVCPQLFFDELTIGRSEEHTSELQSPCNLVCRLLLEKKKKKSIQVGKDKRDVRNGCDTYTEV